jgi:hypothetical protein
VVYMSQEFRSKVLFIAGPGRSGSTLLDMLLGQINGFCSTGELRFIWKRSFGQNQLCGCGKPFRECEFWTDVVREAFGGFDNVDHERLEGLRYSAEHRVSNGVSINDSGDLRVPYQEYFEACSTLYQAIHRVSGCEFIVDSSKNIANGFLLSTLPDIDLFTVHLIRDSRAVAFSWQREKLRPEIHWEQKFMSQRGILKSASRWNSRNMLAQKLKHASKKYTFLRYEDLVNDPQKMLAKLLTDLEIGWDSLDFLSGCHANLKPSHTVSGNPVRFVSREIEIQPDMQWRNNMAGHQKLLVTLMTLPLLLKYGYLREARFNDRVAG